MILTLYLFNLTLANDPDAQANDPDPLGNDPNTSRKRS